MARGAAGAGRGLTWLTVRAARSWLQTGSLWAWLLGTGYGSFLWGGRLVAAQASDPGGYSLQNRNLNPAGGTAGEPEAELAQGSWATPGSRKEKRYPPLIPIISCYLTPEIIPSRCQQSPRAERS